MKSVTTRLIFGSRLLNEGKTDGLMNGRSEEGGREVNVHFSTEGGGFRRRSWDVGSRPGVERRKNLGVRIVKRGERGHSSRSE